MEFNFEKVLTLVKSHNLYGALNLYDDLQDHKQVQKQVLNGRFQISIRKLFLSLGQN